MMKYVILSHFTVYNYYYDIELAELIPANRNGTSNVQNRWN